MVSQYCDSYKSASVIYSWKYFGIDHVIVQDSDGVYQYRPVGCSVQMSALPFCELFETRVHPM